MNRIAMLGLMTALGASPALAQEADSLQQIRKELDEMKAKNERLEAEVEYLKQETKGQRKEAAVEAVEVEKLKGDASKLKGDTSKFKWSGDFRYRNEQIQTAPNNTVDEHTRGRDRIRLRFGVTAKINDTVTGRFQIATSGGTSGDPRSTNQTLGEDWSRKSVGIDLAYIDWKPVSFMDVQLGKTPQPWTRTGSYFWDGDLTPEGAAFKFSNGGLFGGVYYEWLNERHSGSATGKRSDSKLVGAQIGWKQAIGPTALTVAGGYFDVTNVQNEVTSSTALAGAPATSCSANGVFFGGSTNGNTVYDNNGAAASGCNALLSDFGMFNLLAQLDLKAGAMPITVFVDYMKNLDAVAHPTLGDKLDTAYAAGVTFNKASAPKSWEVGLVYQQSEADAIFGQFHDSDFGDGRTDTDGFVIKGAFVPAANWTLSGTLLINQLHNDTGSATTQNLDYKRLQLDLNFKF